MRNVPELFKTQEMCNRAVKKDVVPEQFITRETCLEVLKGDVDLFFYIPKRFLDDPEIVETARCKGGDGKCEA